MGYLLCLSYRTVKGGATVQDTLDTSATLLNRVVDSLMLRMSRNRQPSEWLLSASEGWREYQQNWEPTTEPLTVELADIGTFILRGAKRPYEFTLAHPDIGDVRIWNPQKWESAVATQTGQILFDFRSKFLQLLGLDAVRELVQRVELLLVDSTSGPIYTDEPPRPDFLRLVRGDLAVDIKQETGLSTQFFHTMVCQSRNLDRFYTLTDKGVGQLINAALDDRKGEAPPMDNKGVSIRTADAFQLPLPRAAEQATRSATRAFAQAVKSEMEDGRRGGRVSRVVTSGRRPQSVYFGRMSSPVYCNVYNKLSSLVPQHKEYMEDVWLENGWDGQGEVWRWEFRVSGDMLKSLYVGKERVDVRDFDTFCDYIPAIWAYLTHAWLRQVDGDPFADKETQRMDTTPYWQVIQGAWKSTAVIRRDNGRYLRIKDDRDRQRRIKELEAQGRGCLVTAAALKEGRFSLPEHLEPDIHVDTETGEIIERNVGRDKSREELIKLIDDDFAVDVLKRREMVATDDLSECARTSLANAVIAGLQELGLSIPDELLADDLQDSPDAKLAAALRAERMSQGRGS